MFKSTFIYLYLTIVPMLVYFLCRNLFVSEGREKRCSIKVYACANGRSRITQIKWKKPSFGKRSEMMNEK